MLSERESHIFSQLVYLDYPAQGSGSDSPSVGALLDYYNHSKVGKVYINARFGSIPKELESWRNFLQEEAQSVRNFHIRNVWDDNNREGSGFYGCSYISPQGKVVAAFRGSEMLGNRQYKNDYETDFALAYSLQTPQQKKVEQYLASFDDFYLRPYYLTGHSLGGNLAVYGAIKAPNQRLLLGCHAYNAPGFNGKLLKEYRERIAEVKDRIRLLQNEHDLISSLLLQVTVPVVLQSAYHPQKPQGENLGDLLYPHSNFVYVPEEEGFARAQSGKKDPLCERIHWLTAMLLKLPDFVKKRMAHILLDAIYAVQPPEKRLEYMMEGIMKYMVRSGVTGSEEWRRLSSGLYLARFQAQAGNWDITEQAEEAGRPFGDEEAGEACLLLFRLLTYHFTAEKERLLA